MVFYIFFLLNQNYKLNSITFKNMLKISKFVLKVHKNVNLNAFKIV